MDGKYIKTFKADQEKLMLHIEGINNANGHTDKLLPQVCELFLRHQRKELEVLREKREIHMKEKGKVNFRLVPEESVTVSFLKELYAVFAKLLEDFIQAITALEQRINPKPIFLEYSKQEAINIGMEMLEISLLLKFQPDSTNYDKNQNPIPEVLCLGSHCFSEFVCEESKCKVTIVSETDLLRAARESQGIDKVGGLDGVTVQENSTKKTNSKKSKLKSKPEAVEINFGSWSIPKNKISQAEKGSAHKDWVRLKFMIKITYRGVTKDLWLLSLPFNIRKGSVQMYTFIGALMWYFYNTSDPYKEFTFPTRLPTLTFLDMLITRIEVIGRKLSADAKILFKELVTNLSSNRSSESMVDLDTVIRGPPSSKKKQDSIETCRKTQTVYETIDTYGFFTWFYALVYSLETSGYLNKLWLEGYIYDLCTPEYAKALVLTPTFGSEWVLIRPSMSNIYNHQGTNIHMGFSFFFKTQNRQDKVISINQHKRDFFQCGLYECLTYKLPLRFIWMSDNSCKNIDNLKDDPTEQVYHYHNTMFTKKKGSEMTGSDAIIKHCSSCHCRHQELNSRDEETQPKKSRNLFGNSDQLSSTSDGYRENLAHKAVSSPSGCSNGFLPVIQSSPGASNSGSENMIPYCEQMLVDPMTNKKALRNRFYDAAESMIEKCPDEIVMKFTHMMIEEAAIQSGANTLNQMLEEDVLEGVKQLLENNNFTVNTLTTSAVDIDKINNDMLGQDSYTELDYPTYSFQEWSNTSISSQGPDTN